MIKKGKWKDDDRWEIDGHTEFGSVDVKCIKAYYNINRKKLIHILKQRGLVDYFYFIEWKKRPDRLLKTGDKVESTSSVSYPMKNSSRNYKSRSKRKDTTSMSGKHLRTEGKNFLGQKYKVYSCTKCKTRFEDFGLNKGKQICPTCCNPPTFR